MNPQPLTAELEEKRRPILKRVKELGLDPFDTRFFLLNYDDINQLISYQGFPRRMHHWSYGMNSILQENAHQYGFARIYEMVINQDPAYAYLYENNPFTINVFVICHVYAHSDFLKNNIWFSKSNRNMIPKMNRHARRRDKIADMVGEEEVEDFLDICHSLNGLIDVYSPFIKRDFESYDQRMKEKMEPPEKPRLIETGNPFIDRMLNDSEWLRKERERIRKEMRAKKRFPREMQRDVLKFLIDNAKYSNPDIPHWKLELLEYTRDEAYYFSPQKLTQIMNEGWASYWHYKLMAEEGFADDAGFFDFSSLHGQVAGMSAQPTDLNPYAIGLALWRWIEHKWNTGRHGKAYEECDNLLKRLHWDTGDMKGREKIFELRKFYNDVLFINEFVDEEFCEEHKLFQYKVDRQGRIYIASKDPQVIKDTLIQKIYNGGEPLIYVKDANHRNKGELLLFHDFDYTGQTLDLKKSLPVLRNIRTIWGRDVSIETKVEFVGEKKQHEFVKSIIRAEEDAFDFRFYDAKGKLIKHDKKEFNEKKEEEEDES